MLGDVILDWFAGEARITLSDPGPSAQETTILCHGYSHADMTRTFPRGRRQAVETIEISSDPTYADLWVLRLEIQSGDFLTIHARAFEEEDPESRAGLLF